MSKMTVYGQIYVTLEVETDDPREAVREFVRKYEGLQPDPGMVDDFPVLGVCDRCNEPIMDGDRFGCVINEDCPPCGCGSKLHCWKCDALVKAEGEEKRRKLGLSAGVGASEQRTKGTR